MAVAIAAILLAGGVAATYSAQAPVIHADSSAVVVLVDNRTPVPVEVFLKLSLTYHRLGSCGPVSHCLYVIPSVQLGTQAAFQVAGLAHGDTEPDDSPLVPRVPGRVSTMQYTVAMPEPPVPERA